jgi:GT2 family glycosyltransferase
MLSRAALQAWAFAFQRKSSRVYQYYFDADWYLSAYPEISGQLKSRGGKSPGLAAALRHYLGGGWRKGYDPNPYFDARWYLEKCAEAKRSRLEPLRHYVEKGWRDGQSPSAYFDAAWYLQQNQDVARSGMEPLLHYMRHGWREGRNPSPYFDGGWYRRQLSRSVFRSCEPLRHYIEEGWRAGFAPGPGFDPQDYLKRNPDCREADVDPLKHFLLCCGARSGGAPASPNIQVGAGERKLHILRRDRASSPAAQFLALSPVPLVSIIICNFNGAAHLKDLFESLRAQTYDNFEIIFVDDNSTDESIEIAQRYRVDCLVRTPKNVGFAQANNLALSSCSGELIALLNNDMRVDANWLEALVTAMKQSPTIAAVSPKIRFWTKFQRVAIRGAREFELDESTLLASLKYKKFFAPLGDSWKGRLRSRPDSLGETIVLHAPIQTEPLSLQLHTLTAQEVSISASGNASSLRLSPGEHMHAYAFSRSDQRGGYFLVNNAGSALDANLNPYDRGFGHVDDGEFDRDEEVDLFCGGAVLLRRDALHGRKLFISELVAYYEDSELSLRLRDRGYKIVYCPKAIVYHKHSATNVEKSAFWLRQTNRNKIAFDYIAAPPAEKRQAIEKGKQHLNHMRHWVLDRSDAASVEEIRFAEEIPRLYAEIDEIVARIDSGEATRSCAPRIGVYNPYWSTLGGGEAHALDVAAALRA